MPSADPEAVPVLGPQDRAVRGATGPTQAAPQAVPEAAPRASPWPLRLLTRLRDARRYRLSLGGWLVLLVVAVALPLATLTALAVRSAHDTARARAEDAFLSRARILALAVDREIERVETGLQVLAASAALSAGDLEGVEAEMRALSAELEDAPIALAAADGRQLLNTAWAPGERRAGIMATPTMRAALDSGRMEISNLVPSVTTGQLMTAVAVPVRHGMRRGDRPSGEGAALVLAASLRRGQLTRTLRDPGRADAGGMIASLLDRTGTIAARTVREEVLVGTPVRPEFRVRLAQDREGVAHGLRTHEGVAASFAFARAPHSGYVVALALPDAEFRAPYQAALKRVGLAAVALLLLSAGLAMLLARRIGRELRRLGPPDAARAGVAQAEMPHGTAPGAVADGAPVLPGSMLREVDELGRALALAGAERDRAMAALAASEHRFRALAAAGALVIWRSDAAGNVLDAEGWEELTGQGAAAARDGGWLAMLHVEDRADAVRAWAAARANDQPVDLEFRIRSKAAGPEGGPGVAAWRWVRVRGVPVVAGPGADRASGASAEWVGVLEDVEHRRLAEQALAQREARLRLAVEAARLTTWEYDPRLDRGSRVGRADQDYLAPVETFFSLADWLAHVHPVDRETMSAALAATAAGRTPVFQAEVRVRRRPPAEGWAWVASYGAVVERDAATGEARRIAGVAQDISARRDAEERRAMLAREVDHRAKNVLAVVQSVLRLARRDRPEEFAAAVEARVAALARAHTLLAEGGWAGADLRRLAERELAGFAPNALDLRGPEVALAPAAVQPLAMVLHELATNATKHGALSVPAGRVMLRWATPNDRLRLDWTESGGPPVAGPPERRGFGSRIIAATVRQQLGGQLEVGWDAAGLRVRIDLPAARIRAGAQEAATALPQGTFPSG